jgi:hypothetical protein
MRVPRYTNPTNEFLRIRFGYGFADMHDIIESMELHQSLKDFRCAACSKTFGGSSYYIGNGDFRVCVPCGIKRFDRIKEYVSAVRDVTRFHRRIIKRLQRRIDTADFNSKL